MENVEFRLITGKKEGTWTLPPSVAKKDGTLKPTDYFKGSSSYFVEDNKDTIYKRTPIVFRYNDILNDPACNFIADGNNEVLIAYLKSHSLYGKFFKIHNEDEINKEISDFNDKIFEAFTIVNESSAVKLKSVAFAILGKQAIGWKPEKCAAELKETAKKTPDLIISKRNATNYEAYYMSALAFNSKIVKTTIDANSVIWNDDRQSIILRLDKGDSPIEKLGDYIFEGTEKSREVLQELGLRIEKLDEKTNTTEVDSSVLDAKDKEIEALKAKLAQASKQDKTKEESYSKDDSSLETIEMTLEEAQKEYEDKIGKLPPNKKNDVDWLAKKLGELD